MGWGVCRSCHGVVWLGFQSSFLCRRCFHHYVCMINLPRSPSTWSFGEKGLPTQCCWSIQLADVPTPPHDTWHPQNLRFMNGLLYPHEVYQSMVRDVEVNFEIEPHHAYGHCEGSKKPLMVGQKRSSDSVRKPREGWASITAPTIWFFMGNRIS